jgi:biopolymer transport protein TolQ
MIMKGFRIAVFTMAALIFALSMDASLGAAFAQLQRAQSTPGAPPRAAPTGEDAASAPLAAPVQGVDAVAAGVQNTEVTQTFTPWGLFQRADIIVKCVLVALLLASIWSWAVMIDKAVAFSALKRKAARFEQNFWSGRALDDLYQYYSTRADHPIAALFVAALREWKRSFERGVPRADAIPGIRERVEKAMNISIARETDRLERGLGYLATVGSTAPFVGLFGTVWGIMNAFQAISMRQDTTLAVVAPGIAEALFATALGLVAAIPAVIFYNRFVNELGRYQNRLETFADELSAFLSRQLDEGGR